MLIGDSHVFGFGLTEDETLAAQLHRRLTEDGKAPVIDPTRASFSGSDSNDSVLLLRGTDNVLQLQWVENRVNWESVDRLPAGVSAVPGWIDTARDWFRLRPGRAMRIERDGPENSFLSITKLTWFYSVPIQVRAGVGYLLAGRNKGPQGEGYLSWQSLDKDDSVVSEGITHDRATSSAWIWQVDYMPCQLQWNTMRVQLATVPQAVVFFDDVMLLEIEEPNLPR
ncbi:MAG: hypothetical protein NTZ09_15240 [Candidatus Hydrogenedentes bacterium]|nr:hypothetical protein [Candidatus Hydrogenedentota bacterium]